MGFSKILIANRGEIACRVARTARSLGYRTVAVFSDADAGALHVKLADEAVRIGPPPAPESYLAGGALIAAAKLAGADAVHPGYGFLSENAEFAAACEEAGLVFIGPPAAAIRAMGNKVQAKRLLAAAGVPCVPGWHGADPPDATLAAEARRLGFPVMVKAAAGGGGRGMRLVAGPEELAAALAAARSEALRAFGSGELMLERALVDARHVEIQVFADSQGNIVHLGERDCSVQRRHQKLIEESPVLPPELRARMGETAVAAARAIAYRGAGTVEFLLDGAGRFYFLEMNTRLQVEHPVTEAVTGQDLVAWQLAVAAGEPLPLKQDEIRCDGHAIEARLYAEDPARGFLPQSGTVVAWEPPQVPGVRTDHGLQAGQPVTPHYDALLAKVIAHGRTREEARRRLVLALEETLLLGLATNRELLCRVLRHPLFVAGGVTTAFLDRHADLRGAAPGPAPEQLDPGAAQVALAAVLWFEASQAASAAAASTAVAPVAAAPPAAGQTGAAPTAGPLTAAPQVWRSTGVAAWPLRLSSGDARVSLTVTCTGPDCYEIAGDGTAAAGRTVRIEVVERRPGMLRFTSGGLLQRVRYAFAQGALHLDLAGRAATFRETLFERDDAAQADGEGRMLAPMNGRIVAVLAKEGDRVAKGQRIVVLEAMKMQHEISAQRAGTIERIAVQEGEQVATRQLLAALAAESGG